MTQEDKIELRKALEELKKLNTILYDNFDLLKQRRIATTTIGAALGIEYKLQQIANNYL